MCGVPSQPRALAGLGQGKVRQCVLLELNKVHSICHFRGRSLATYDAIDERVAGHNVHTAIDPLPEEGLGFDGLIVQPQNDSLLCH